MNNPTPKAEDDDRAVEALRQVLASRRTIRSVKETILACMLINAVCRPHRSGRHTTAVVAATVIITAASAHWHILHYLLHFVP
jgi:hypothetical protein